MFQNERRKLKKICKEIGSEFIVSSEVTYKQYCMSLLSVMALCVLGRIRGNNSQKFDKATFSTEIEILRRNFPFFDAMLDRVHLISNVSIEKIFSYFNEIDNFDNTLAWAYQYLKHDKEKEAFSSSLKGGIKIEGDALAPATQFFTEDYMVRYLVNNSVDQVVNRKNILNLKVIDPACGGGNFLVYALQVLYEQYSCHSGSNTELLKVLVENVLIGYDIDPDLSEISALSIFLKASSYVSPDHLELKPSIYTSQTSDEQIGTLRKNESVEYLVRKVSTGNLYPYSSVFKEGIFDLVVTNPPFMGNRLMGKELLAYLRNNYPLSKGDLCIAFISRCIELLNAQGVCGIVNQTSWMFLKSYSQMRRTLLEGTQLLKIVDLGSNSFLDLNGEKTTVALTLLEKGREHKDVAFYKLKSLSFEQKEAVLSSGFFSDDITYYRSQAELLQNEGYVFQYESTNAVISSFKNFPPYREFATPMQGTSTGANKEFIDYAWNRNDPDWVLVSKGGGYSKWSGLNLFKVKWGKEAEFIKANPGSAVRNLKYMKETDLVYSDTGTLGLSVRLLKEGQVFIASGPGIRIHKGEIFAHLAFLNTRVVSYLLKLLSPKYTISAGYIGQIPVNEEILTSPILAEMGKKCYQLKESYLSRKLANQEYTQSVVSLIETVDNYLESQIVRDLQEEYERLTIEFEIEKFVQAKLLIAKVDLQKIEEAVGKPVCSITNTMLNATISDIDNLMAGLLSNSCQYVSNKKRIFGSEGVLEDISNTLNVHPARLLEFIMKNRAHLVKVKELYLDDLIHKACLEQFGFIANNYELKDYSKDELLSGIHSKLSSLEVEYLESWLDGKLWTIHHKVFYNNPVLELVSTSRGLRYRSLGSLVTC